MNPANEPNLVEPTSRLLELDPIDEVDTEELKMAAAFDVLATQLQGKPETEVQHMLQKASSESLENHAEMVGGLIYGMITDGENAEQWLHYMNFVVRDGYAHAVGVMRYMVGLARFSRMKNECQRQLLWLLNHMVELSVPSMETVILTLLRQLRGGDVTAQNIWLISNTLELLMRHRDWLFTHPRLISTSLYVYLRLMLDHAKFTPILEREVAFCSCLLREKFLECSDIGRDLIRALQDVARIPEFEQIWRDLLVEPRKLSPHCKGLVELLRKPTPRHYLQSRLTLEMEQRILFIMERLSWERHRRNLSWFVERYLSTPESDAIIADVIRYIVGVYHPSNEVLASNIVPRYVVIGGIVRYIKTNVAASMTKLAIFYDFLFYQPSIDSIMNIEPAILLMYKSLDKYAYMTGTLLEFLLCCIDEYYPPIQQAIRKHVQSALSDILQKNVINSLVPIVECSGIDSHVRDVARTTFQALLASNPPSNASAAPSHATPDLFSQPVESFPQGLADEDGELLSNAAIGEDEEMADKTIPDSEMEILVNDDGAVEMDSTMLQGQVENEINGEDEREEGEGVEEDEMEANDEEQEHADEDEEDEGEEEEVNGESLWLLGGSVNEYRAAVSNRDSVQASQSLKDMLVVFSSMAVPIDEFIPVIRRSVIQMAKETSDIPRSYLIDSTSNDIDIIDTLFNSCWDGYNHDQDKTIQVLHQLLNRSTSLSARWLLYLTKQYMKKETIKDTMQQYLPYKVALNAIGITDVADRLNSDIQLIQENHPETCFNCLATLFQHLPDIAVGNEFLVHTLVSVIEPNDLFEVTCNLISGQWHLFGSQCQAVLREMLQSWDTLEQMNAWHLLQAELVASPEQASDLVQYLLEIIDPSVNQDALAGLLALLRGLSPTSSLLHVLLSSIEWPSMMMNDKSSAITIQQQFALNAFIQWHANHEAELKEALKQWMDEQESRSTEQEEKSTTDENKEQIKQWDMNLLHLLEYWRKYKQETIDNWLGGPRLVRCIRQLLKRYNLLEHPFSRLAWKNGAPTTKKTPTTNADDSDTASALLGNGSSSRRSSVSSLQKKSRSQKSKAKSKTKKTKKENDLFDAEESSHTSSSSSSSEEEEEEEKSESDDKSKKNTNKKTAEKNLRRSTRAAANKKTKENESDEDEDDEDAVSRNSDDMEEDSAIEDEDDEEQVNNNEEESGSDEEANTSDNSDDNKEMSDNEDTGPRRRRRTRSMSSVSNQSTGTSTRSSKTDTLRKQGTARPKKRRILEDSD